MESLYSIYFLLDNLGLNSPTTFLQISKAYLDKSIETEEIKYAAPEKGNHNGHSMIMMWFMIRAVHDKWKAYKTLVRIVWSSGWV